MKEKIEEILSNEIRYHPSREYDVISDINKKCKGAAERSALIKPEECFHLASYEV